MPIDSYIGKRPIAVILFRQRFAGGGEVIVIGLCPPICQSALSVELGARVVERVADLVPNERPDCAVVACVIAVWIEPWTLNDRRREVQSVLQWKIEGVYRLWSSAPLAGIGSVPQSCQLIVVLEQSRPQMITQCVVFCDFQTRIVAPMIGISHADL